jgi:integrative and conjugative element protein (TIGR02256 family)
MLGGSIEELAIKLDLRDQHHKPFHIPIGGHKSHDLETVPVNAIKPTYGLSKVFAQVLSGVRSDDPAIVAVGAGSLGSQVIMNLARQGFGKWAVVDDDHLLPHNFPRHALVSQYEGMNKAVALASEIRQLLNDDLTATPFPLDILQPDKYGEELSTAIGRADAILDLSASHAVARFLADASYTARRICAFLSPFATYLVILTEGQDRAVRLDDLEMQFKAALGENEHLQTVFADQPHPVGYAGSCRDASVQLPQDVIAIHAATAANFVKKRIFDVAPGIDIWKWSDSESTLARFPLPIYAVLAEQADDWKIRISDHAMQLMRFYRRRRLPNETGGVLLGRMDVDRKVVFVATVLPSPPDSAEWPTAYIRGAKGLRAQVDHWNNVAGGDMCYVGEWHSHPDGCSTHPSDNDREAHRWIAHEMGKVGLPGIVLIQGSADRANIMLAVED